ncbi:hypothetical protein [Alcanivorax sp.]|uniref:RipA family octameric membrane protein n=1 Tax=Alcanivorax sp. TaxID=1872427 RepID=UPI0025826298|nr:hypothetical protein [Alcanivorax sp.]
MATKIEKTLMNELPAEPYAAAIEQYKLYVETAEKNSSRRLTANSFFLTINTGLSALLGYMTSFKEMDLAVAQLAVPIAGIILSYFWYRLIISYREMNRAKFKVIHEMENHLPFRAFVAEWEAVEHGENPKKYRPYTKIESAVPRVFIVVHSIVLFSLFK